MIFLSGTLGLSLFTCLGFFLNRYNTVCSSYANGTQACLPAAVAAVEADLGVAAMVDIWLFMAIIGYS